MKGRENPFADLRPTPANHFKLCFYRAVLNAIQQVARSLGSFEAAFAQFPFLAGYNNELAERGLAGMSAGDACVWWTAALDGWELAIGHPLPLRELCEAAGLDQTSLAILMTIGLVEEDARFGFMFEYLQGIMGQPRPTQGLLHSWFGPEDSVRSSIRRMQEVGSGAGCQCRRAALRPRAPGSYTHLGRDTWRTPDKAWIVGPLSSAAGIKRLR